MLFDEFDKLDGIDGETYKSKMFSFNTVEQGNQFKFSSHLTKNLFDSEFDT